jgi:hypothetical protein
MSYHSSHPSGSAEFERKLRACNPHRQLVQTTIGAVIMILTVGAALYVALFPKIWF